MIKTTTIVCCAIGMTFFGARITAQTLGTTWRDLPSVAPILTEESMPEEAGECNLRTTSAYHVAVLGSEEFLPRTQLFCGFSQRWSGEIDVPMAHGNDSYGVGDIGVSAKFKLRDQTASIPALVLGLETTFRTGRVSVADAKESGMEVQPFVALLKQIGRVTIQGNVGLSIVSCRNEHRYGGSYNAAVAIPLRRIRFALLGEVNASSSPSGTMLSFSPGVHRSLGRAGYVAFALPISVLNGSAQLGAVLQFQMRVR